MADEDDDLDRARRGDRDSFGRLVRRHQRRVYAAALHILGNHADADDATQEAFIHAWELPPEAWGTQRWLNLPGITASVAQMVEALRKVAGDKVAARVEWKPDARIQAIVKTWPARFTTQRALQLGFLADKDVETVIRDYIRDEGIKV